MLREYLFVDRRRLSEFVDQLGGLPPQKKKQTRKVGGSLTGPAGEISIEEIPGSGSDIDRIEFLLDHLRRGDQFQVDRPNNMTMFGNSPSYFVLEEFTAKPIILASGSLAKSIGSEWLKLWVSDPKALGDNFGGSFLFLVEAPDASNLSSSIHSGCSALRFLVNSIDGRDGLDRSGPDQFGRDNPMHPLEKLASLNAQVGDERRLQALYTVRYMTNEQCFVSAGIERRTHDVLAYPIFLRTA